MFDALHRFGDAGTAIFLQQKFVPPLVVKYLTTEIFEADGEAPERIIHTSYYELVPDRSGLSAAGHAEYMSDKQAASLVMVAHKKDNADLLSYLLAFLSPASVTDLKSKEDKENGFVASVGRKDTFRLWALIEETHLFSSGRAKLVHLKDFLSTHQSGSHEDYLNFSRERFALFKHDFESPTHPGYVSLDELAQVVYVNGLDQTYFERIIEHYLVSEPVTCSQLQETCHNFYKAKGGVSSIVLPRASSALVASTEVAKSRFSRSLGPYDPLLHGLNCQFCWSRGFVNLHDIKVCRFKARAEQFNSAKASKPVVLVSNTPVVPDAPLLPFNAMILPGAPNAVDDARLISMFETCCLQYHDAKARTAARGSLGLVAHISPPSNQDAAVQLLLGLSRRPLPACAALLSNTMDTHTSWWYDNAASYTIIRKLSQLIKPVVLDAPIRVGGVTDGVDLTHVGIIPFFGEAYFAPEASCNLISLSVLQRNGFSYETKGLDQLVIKAPDGKVIDEPYLCSNNLYPVSPSMYEPCDLQQKACVAPTEHYNAEQRHRCDRAELLHQGRAVHCSDDVLVETLANGGFPTANVTPADVRLNRKLRGPCPQCLEAKLKNKSMPSSETPPATAVGQRIVLDITDLKCKSTGGNMVGIRLVDEFSGDFQEGTAQSKSAIHIYDATMYLLRTRYIAYGHKPEFLVGDSERSLLATTPLFGASQIALTFVDPGQKAQRVERHIGTMDWLRRAVLASLPFWIPEKYMPYCKRWVADCRNGLVNSRSAPQCSDMIVTGVRRLPHHKYPDVGFGAVCMVQQHDDKRNNLAIKHEHHKVVIPVAELGVCMGYTPFTPGDYDFLLSNGQIVARKIFHPVQIHPFDWPKKLVHSAELRLPQLELIPSVETNLPPFEDKVRDDIEPSAVLPFIDPFPRPIVYQDNAPTDLGHEPIISIPPVVTLPLQHVPAIELSSPIPVSPILPTIQNDQLSGNSVSLSNAPSLSIPVVAATPPRQGRSATFGRTLPPGLWAGAQVASVLNEWIYPKRVVPLSQSHFDCSKSAYIVSNFSESTDVSNSSIRMSRSRRFSSRRLKKVSVLAPSSSSDELTVTEATLLDAIILANELAKLHSPVVAKTSLEVAQDTSLCARAAVVDNTVTAVATYVPDVMNEQCETAWFNSARPDEIELDDIYLSAALVARAVSSSLRPVIVTKCKEVSLFHATKYISHEKLSTACSTEIVKQQALGCLGSVVFRDIDLPSNALSVNAHVLFKEKDDGRFNCRVAGRGDTLPVDPGLISFASVCSDGDKMFCLSAMQAHTQIRQEDLNIGDIDVVGAFLRIKRPADANRLFLRFPKNFPHFLAGMLLEVFGALYGLIESNRLFDLELTRVLIEDAGFVNDAVNSPRTFIKISSADCNLKCICNTHVDDIRTIDNCPELRTCLFNALKARFGDLHENLESHTFTGIELQRYPDRSIVQKQDRYISRVADSVGVAHMATVDMPCQSDFFADSITPEECILADQSLYQSLTGCLVQIKTRDEIKHLISHLCSKNNLPTEGDYAKAIHLLRYLHSTPGLGRRFQSSSLQLVMWCDSSFDNLPNGCSIGAYFLSIGHSNAPFHSVAKSIGVATTPMDAEYINASNGCKSLMHFRYLSEFCGWKQTAVPVYVDCQTAINLAIAPQISKKSLHLNVKHHYIRECQAAGEIDIVHVFTAEQRANVMTKYLGRTQFLKERVKLLNT